jgi:hypothetical protein
MIITGRRLLLTWCLSISPGFTAKTQSSQRISSMKTIKKGLNKPVIPAQAGIQGLQDQRGYWMTAFAEMTDSDVP